MKVRGDTVGAGRSKGGTGEDGRSFVVDELVPVEKKRSEESAQMGDWVRFRGDHRTWREGEGSPTAEARIWVAKWRVRPCQHGWMSESQETRLAELSYSSKSGTARSFMFLGTLRTSAHEDRSEAINTDSQRSEGRLNVLRSGIWRRNSFLHSLGLVM